MALSPERSKLNKAYRAAITAAGLDDDVRRDMLETMTGHRSSKDCTDAQLRLVLDRLNNSTSKKPFKKSRRGDVRLIHALWGQLGRDGKLNARSAKERKNALRTFCARMSGLKGIAETDPEFLDAHQASLVIEALKAWNDREDKIDG